jgi:lipopolysaccharide transport protein LptA
MMRARLYRVLLAVGMSAFLAIGAVGQEVSTLTIGVVPFERNAPPGASVPEVATLLADRMGTLGVAKVVGPAEFEFAADAEPDDASVQAWAQEARVAALVAGRITRIGSQLSVDVRLHSGDSGAVEGTYVAEIISPDQLDAVVDALASQILAGAAPLAQAAGSPAVSAAGSSAPAAPAPPSGGGTFGMPFDSDRPLSIRSDELQSIRDGNSRKFVFTKNVVVVQDEMTIKSNRLEAIYPPESSQPSRMVATGRVRMMNGGNEARCDQATYERAKDSLVCRGNAELQEGTDCVKGEWIEFDLAAETVKVGGGARVVLGGENGNSSNGACR